MGSGRYQQPWERVEVCGTRCRLQIARPEVAFDLEPKIIAAAGDTLALAVAAPESIAQGIVDKAMRGETVAEQEVIRVAMIARTVTDCLAALDLELGLVLELFESLVLGHIEVSGRDVHDWADWSETFGSGPRARWTALGLAIRLTYGPLWTRSPYVMRSKAIADHGVQTPPGVSQVSLWCDQLAAQGRATSAREILTTWTPVELIDAVEALAYSAERERRSQAAARAPT